MDESPPDPPPLSENLAPSGEPLVIINSSSNEFVVASTPAASEKSTGQEYSKK
jgi:hypothetical protein